MKIIKFVTLTLLVCCFSCFAAEAISAPEITGNVEIRAENPAGLRVKAVIDACAANDEKTVEYGFITTRKVFLSANGITPEEFSLDSPVSLVKGVSRGEVDGEMVDRFFDKNDDEIYFACYIHGIDPDYYSDIVVVRPYIISDDGIEYGEPLEVSLYEAASRICDDSDAFADLTEAQQNVLLSIVAESEFTVKFFAEGNLYERLRVRGADKIPVPENPQKDDYIFKGWSEAEGAEIVDVSEITPKKDMTFHAVFEKNPVYYDVIFMVDGNQYSANKVLEGEINVAPSDPSKDGYTFKGWSETEGGNVISVSVAVNSNLTFYAVFEKIPVYYDVVFMVNGEEYASSEILEGQYPECPKEPFVKGYTFVGWSVAEGGVVVNPEKIQVNATAVYYAVFERNVYRVSFWYDGEILEYRDVAEGETATEPQTPELEAGMLFFGWSLEDDNDPEKAVDVSLFVVEGHTDFYAILVPNPNSAEFMEKLARGNEQLKKIRVTGLQKTAVNKVTECIGYILADAGKGIYITKDYVKTTYSTAVEEVKTIVNVDMDSTQRSQFANVITSGVDKDVREFLTEYFDIDTSV